MKAEFDLCEAQTDFVSKIWYISFFNYQVLLLFILLWPCDPTRVMASSFLRFLDHIQRRTTVGRTPLGEWSARRRDLYLTTHNTHNRQTSMPPVGFEPTISAGERPQTYALDRVATGTDNYPVCCFNPLNIELNPICHLLALLGAHPILHVSRIRVKLITHMVRWRLQRQRT